MSKVAVWLEKHLGRIWKRMLILGLLIVVFAYAQGPVKEETKGPLYKAIADEDNPYVRSNRAVEKIPGGGKFNLARVVLYAPEGITPVHLAFIQEKTFVLEGRGWTVVSPANYWKKGRNGEPDDKWIPTYFDPEARNREWVTGWLNEACKNRALCGPGKLISPDGTEIAIEFFLDVKEKEIKEVLQLYKELSGLPFKGWFEEVFFETKYGLLEYDVPIAWNVEGATFHLESDVSIRVGMVFGFFMDSYTKSGIGYLVLLLFLVFHFRFQRRYYWPVWISIVLVDLFTTGSIWPLHRFGIYETSFTLPPMITAVFITLSFCVHVMETLRMHGDSWTDVEATTHLAIRRITQLTILNFLIFGYWFSNLSRAVEMEVVLLLGTLWGWTLAKFFLPALYFFFTRRGSQEKKLKGWQQGICDAIDKGVKGLNGWIIRGSFAIYRSPAWQKVIGFAPLVLFIVMFGGFMQGYFTTETDALTYLPESSRHIQDAKRANREGGPGVDLLEMYVGMSEVKSCLKEETCFQNLMEFQGVIEENIPEARGTFSMGQEVEYQLRMDPAARFEDIAQEVLDGQSDTNPLLRRYLNPSGFVYLSMNHSLYHSGEYRDMRGRVERFIHEFQESHPGFLILLSGESLYYGEVARIIPEQFGQFVITSLLSIFLFSYFFIGRECKVVNPLRTGWVMMQPFMFAAGSIGLCMVALGIPLDIATAAILPTITAAGSDSCFFPCIRFFGLLQEGLFPEEAMKKALEEKGQAAIVDWFGNSLCLVILVTSYFRPVFYLGTLSMVALFLCIGWSITTALPLLMVGIQKEERHGKPKFALIRGGGGRGDERRVARFRLW